MEQLNILIRVGAFRFTRNNKKELLWEANFLHKKMKEKIPVSGKLFHSQPPDFKLPQLVQTALEDGMDEIELFGFPLCNPFSMADMPAGSFTMAKDLG